jgi:UDP-N-acetylglucosamine diphosphorylase/glucosamine-1-phosphate N-acetyltransferase
MRICIFEDKGYENLYPLSLTRPVFQLKCGQITLRERILRSFPGEKISYFIRNYLVPIFQKNQPGVSVNDTDVLKNEDVLFINGRWLLGKGELQRDGHEEVRVCGKDILYLRVRAKSMKDCFSPDFTELFTSLKQRLKKRQMKASLITYPWDLIENNSRVLREDFDFRNNKGIQGEFSSSARIYGREDNVFVAKSAKIQPLVLLDNEEGPIYIDEGATVFAHSHIRGPSYIGKRSQILGAKIGEGTSIGPLCRMGGEVEESIIHGFSNKPHAGFLGHSYVGEWVNMGALCTNSDLKNDYSRVQVHIKGKFQDSGLVKVGSFIGDHSKLGIGCLLNTGTVIGVSSNVVAAAGVLPKFVPSFTWCLNGQFYKGHGFEKMIDTAKVVMSRRDVTMSLEEVKILKKVFKTTEKERDRLIERTRR